MRKKLLAGVMALALCSTNMPLQTIFAGEFTSGNLEEVSEETPEIFSDDNQEVIEETEEELSVFSSESIPEFSNEANIMPATADGTDHINEINIINYDGSIIRTLTIKSVRTNRGYFPFSIVFVIRLIVNFVHINFIYMVCSVCSSRHNICFIAKFRYTL